MWSTVAKSPFLVKCFVILKYVYHITFIIIFTYWFLKIHSLWKWECDLSKVGWVWSSAWTSWIGLLLLTVTDSHLQSQSKLYHVSWWYYTLVIDLIGPLRRDVIGRLSVKPWCYWLWRLVISNWCILIRLLSQLNSCLWLVKYNCHSLVVSFAWSRQ